MKILFVCSLYSPHIGGGAEITLKLLVEGLQLRGHDVVVLTTGPSSGLHKEEENGVPVYRAGIKNIYWHHSKQRQNPVARMMWHWRDRYNRAMQGYVKEIIQREKPDVVSCHNLAGWSISVWDEITDAGIPIVQVLHDLYMLCPRSTMFCKGKACETQCASCAMMRRDHAEGSQKVSAVVGVSEYVLKRVISQGYFAGVDQHAIHNARHIADPGPRKQLAEDAPIRFGYIGTLSESKGIEWLIDQFHAKNLNATLSIAGTGKEDYERRLHGLVDPSKVKFRGYVKPQDFYPEIDVCVVPSIWPEPLGMVAAEACAYHVPVVAARSGGLPEMIQDGENGLLCDPLQPNSLGSAIECLALDREMLTRLTSNARVSISRMLSVENWVISYEAIYRSVIPIHLAKNTAYA